MSKLEIGSKFDALRGRDVAICHEDHIGDWPPGEDCATNELADEVDTAVLVRDRHDDAYWNEQNGTDAQGK